MAVIEGFHCIGRTFSDLFLYYGHKLTHVLWGSLMCVNVICQLEMTTARPLGSKSMEKCIDHIACTLHILRLVVTTMEVVTRLSLVVRAASVLCIPDATKALFEAAFISLAPTKLYTRHGYKLREKRKRGVNCVRFREVILLQTFFCRGQGAYLNNYNTQLWGRRFWNFGEEVCAYPAQ